MAQHEHHNAVTHATALCSWLCMAADAGEGTSVHLIPIEQVDVIEQDFLGLQISAVLSFQPPSRAPPFAEFLLFLHRQSLSVTAVATPFPEGD
jgi:hypothetical protein